MVWRPKQTGPGLDSGQHSGCLGYPDSLQLWFMPREAPLQIKLLSMNDIPRNGNYNQRRKLFVGAPFHNMYSCLPLDWREQEQTTLQKQRPSLVKNQEKERLRQLYQMSVEARLNERFNKFAHYNTIQAEEGVPSGRRGRKNDDTLSRQLEMFNNSKVVLGNDQLEGSPSRQRSSSHQDYALHTIANPQRPDSHKLTKSQAKQDLEHPFQSSTLNQSQHMPSPSYRQHSPQPEQPLHSSRQTQNNSVVNYNYSPGSASRYQSSPYKNLAQQIEQIYTGSKPEQYPFRNVVPDKLENYLREKTKADHKRAYQVSLNLFKH